MAFLLFGRCLSPKLNIVTHRIATRSATVFSAVVDKIEKKKNAAIIGGGEKRIKNQHKKVGKGLFSYLLCFKKIQNSSAG